jgi:hypothetical protein
MKHVVSFETAKALKAAGYPQPDFETGQVWYSWVGTPFMPSPLSMRLFNLESGGIWVVDLGLEKRFYAPSATEIIGQISLAESSANLHCCHDGDVVREEWQASGGFQTMSGFSENPSEAAAELYIKMNSK